MATAAVVGVTGTGASRALCSCGWEGEDRTAKRDAYRDKAHHEREHQTLDPVPTQAHDGQTTTTSEGDR